MIRKIDGKYILFSKDGNKKLGEYNTLEEAEHREKQVNYFKNIKSIMKKKGKK